MDATIIDMVEQDVVDLSNTNEWKSCISEKEDFGVQSVQTCRTGIGFIDDVRIVSGVTSPESSNTDVVLEAEEGIPGAKAGVLGVEGGVSGKHARLLLLEKNRGKLQLPPSSPFNQDDIDWEKHTNSERERITESSCPMEQVTGLCCW
jgi:hypothetical protein